MLTAALVGLPLSGRSTVLNLLTGLGIETSGYATGRTDLYRGVVNVPDPRLSFLAELYHPRKVTPAQIEVTEVPGLVRGSSQGAGVGNRFLQEIRQVDALIHVLRAFSDPTVPHPEGSVDPVRDLETLELELLMADLGVVERRLERLSQGKRKPQEEGERQLLTRLRDALGEGRALREVERGEDERRLLAGFGLLTDKPVVWVVNVDEEGLSQGAWPGKDALTALAAERGVPLVVLSAKIEEEIAALPPAERASFLEAWGLEETGVERLARAAYQALGLISFLTAGPDEVRAWPIRRGTRAQEAAGRIHSDIGRGFIRAEVISFADLQAWGTMARAREAGKVRLEGKEYLVQDGDVITFRFHV